MIIHEKSKSATIYDIAEATGLSATTVSRAINNKGYISDETRKKIFKASSELNYVPNHAARMLKTKTSNQIMLSIPDMRNPFYFDLIASIQEVAKMYDYSLLLNYTEAKEKEELKMLENLKRNHIDALILVSINITQKLIDAVNNVNYPVVLSGICVNNIEDQNRRYDYVGVDTQKGIYAAARHLINQGHTKIGYVGLSLETQPGNERFSGFCQAMKEAGLRVDEDCVFIGGYTEIFGYEAGKKLAGLKKDIPTALCTSSDVISVGIYKAFEEEGVKIPEDVSIVGMDNTDITTIIRPKMSSVAISQAEIGRTAAEIIFKRLGGSDEPYCSKIFQPRLVVRESSINMVKR